jgi:hypothetical protein
MTLWIISMLLLLYFAIGVYLNRRAERRSREALAHFAIALRIIHAIHSNPSKDLRDRFLPTPKLPAYLKDLQ